MFICINKRRSWHYLLWSKSQSKIKYIYKLTPHGIAEKTKLTINFMNKKMKEYEELKKELKELEKKNE